MKTPCKHPIKEIDFLEDYHSSPDGYGGDHEYHSYYLICKKCKAQHQLYGNGNRDRNIYASTDDYYKLTGRVANFEEMKKVFKQNNSLFHHISGFNGELRNMIMKNPKLDKQISELDITISTMEKQVRELARKREKLWEEKRSPK